MIDPERPEKSGENATESIGDAGGRQRSTISFPYMDLDDGMEVAQAIQNNVANGECEDDQLAAWLKLSPKSSGFRVQMYTARTFGLIEINSGSKIKLSALGRSAMDPVQTRAAKVQAFLSVPLYAKLFEDYKTRILPSTAASFENAVVLLGVAEKQKGRARQVFERSAEQAGFFEHGRNRLVKPGVQEIGAKSLPLDIDAAIPPISPPEYEPPTDRPALIEALVDLLPKAGVAYSIEDLADWLRAAEGNLRIIYGIKGRITIEVAKGKK